MFNSHNWVGKLFVHSRQYQWVGLSVSVISFMVLVGWFSIRDEYRAQTLIKLASNAVFVGNELKYAPVEPHKNIEQFVQNNLLIEDSPLEKCKAQAILQGDDFLRVICDGGTEAEVMHNIQSIARPVIDRQGKLLRANQSMAKSTLEELRKKLEGLEQRIQFMRDVSKGKDELRTVLVLERLSSLEAERAGLLRAIEMKEFRLAHDKAPGMAPQKTQLLDRGLHGGSWFSLIATAILCGVVTVVSLGLGSILRDQLQNVPYVQR